MGACLPLLPARGLLASVPASAQVRTSWTLSQPAGSKVVPNHYPNMTPSAPILALESKGSPN